MKSLNLSFDPLQGCQIYSRSTINFQIEFLTKPNKHGHLKLK